MQRLKSYWVIAIGTPSQSKQRSGSDQPRTWEMQTDSAIWRCATRKVTVWHKIRQKRSSGTVARSIRAINLPSICWQRHTSTEVVELRLIVESPQNCSRWLPIRALWTVNSDTAPVFSTGMVLLLMFPKPSSGTSSRPDRDTRLLSTIWAYATSRATE
jgi:hypothetical protein